MLTNMPKIVIGIALTLIAVIIAVVFFVAIFPWLMIYLGGLLQDKPLAPKITYGEFPFKLEYEIDGDVIFLEDRVICEYVGVGWNEGIGKYRKWESHLANTGEESILLLTDNTRKIYCFVGNSEYYMGDETYPEPRPLTPRVYLVKSDSEDTVSFSQDELLEQYNIKLISWEFTQPIINSFH